MAVNGGCSYGKVTRQIVIDIKEDIGKLENSFDSFKTEIRGNMDELFNHQSSRLPIWVTVLFTVFGSLIVGLVVKLLN